MKICLMCQTPKSRSEFSPSAKGRGGLHPWCKACVREYSRARYQNIDSPKRVGSSAVILPYTETLKGRTNDRKNDPAFKRAQLVWYRLLKLGRVPPWVKIEDVLPMYEMCARAGKGFAVDHIIPLNGKDVSGLHVPWNLQLVTTSENSRKKTKYHQPW